MEAGLKRAIKESGNNLHLDVANFLKHKGWSVDISPYYCDEFTDKPREIDIIATRRIQILEGAWEGNKGLWFTVALFIECKHFTREINFRVFDNDKNLSRNILCNQAYNLQLGNIFKDNESYLVNHHYLTDTKIAKLYDYDKTKNNEDDVFKSMTQAIKPLIFFKEKKSEGTRGSINYPVVVYSGIDGTFVMPENNTDDVYLDGLKKYKNIIFHLKYSYPKTIFAVPGIRYHSQDFYVDFIHKDELDNFLTNIEENEINKIKLYFGNVKNRDIVEKKYYPL